jgi:endonuclease/exonuclease/phosphatase (EEP) superfamily protein YafD
VVGAAVVAVGRTTGRGRWAPLLAAEAATPLVFLATVLALVLALGGRLRIAALLAAGLAGEQIHWMRPTLSGRRTSPGPRGDLRVLSANLLCLNAETGGWAEQIRAERPDVLLLIEASPKSFRPLERTGVLDDFPYRFPFLRVNASGFALLSRWPADDVHLAVIHDREVLSARIVVGDRTVHLLGVHTRAPTTRRAAAAWQAGLAAIGTAGAAIAGPLIIAGDFNASRDHAPFRTLMATADLVDAHDEVGAGLAGTWPADRLLPALLHLDHVLVSRAFRVTAATMGAIPGSDHRWVQADLCWRAGPAGDQETPT